MKFFALMFLLCISLVGGEDFYKTLGVKKSASEKELKRAYHKLAMKWHPDKNKEDPNAEKKFVAINNAYEILSDPEKRKQYDEFGEDAFKPGGGPRQREQPHFQQGGGGGGFQGFSNPNDFFARFMNNMGGGGGGSFFNTDGFSGQNPAGRREGGRGKQNKALYVGSKNVATLTGKNWQDEGPGAKRDIWAVHFYDGGQCQNCEAAESSWKKLANEFQGQVKFGAVNCATVPKLCKKVGVTSPTSFQVFPLSGAPKSFKESGVEAKELYKFVLQSCSSVVHKMSMSRLEKLLALKCSVDSASSRQKGKQSSTTKKRDKVEIVLVSDKKEPNRVLIQFALKHRDLSFSQGDISDKKTVAALLSAANQAESRLVNSTIFVIHPPKTKHNVKDVTLVQRVVAKPSKEALESLLLTLA